VRPLAAPAFRYLPHHNFKYSMTTKQSLDFFPELVRGTAAINTRLAGQAFEVPAETRVSLVDTVAGRRLVQTEQPRPGYRFALHGELNIPQFDS
jgi:hypothetical protein